LTARLIAEVLDESIEANSLLDFFSQAIVARLVFLMASEWTLLIPFYRPWFCNGYLQGWKKVTFRP
jgi:hypothetical protein